MIRTKAKSLLLSIMLVMASLIFFACKDETYVVRAESIKFEDQNINLLVGDEYNPSIKILPSYATDRSYTLISSDSSVLSVTGGTIKALKAAKGIVLKVEYNTDRTYNDAIVVNIYEESQQLDTPTDFSFDGNKFSFVGVDDAEAYILEINGEEINIGNNTQYLFDNAVAKLGDLYDKKLECSVKAVADGKIFTDSDMSESISIAKMSSVKNVRVEDDTLIFDRVANITKYDVIVELNGQVHKTEQVSSAEFDLNGLIEDGENSGAEYIIKIAPSKDGYAISDIDEVFDAAVVEFNYIVIGKVDNVLLNGKVVSWDFVKNAESYTVKLYYGAEEKEYIVETNNATLECENAGDYSCEVIANSTAVNAATGRIPSNRLEFKILLNPVINASNNQVVLRHVEEATNYLVTISKGLGVSSEVLSQSFIDATGSDIVLDVAEYGSGNYSVDVVAYSDYQNVLASKAVKASWTKLGLTAAVKDGVLSWTDEIQNTISRYQIIANNITKNVEGVNSINLNEFGFVATDDAVEYTIAIKSIGSGAIFDSNVVEGLKVTKLPDAKITGLTDKKFDVTVVSGSNCVVKIYNKQDEFITSLNDGFDLDDSNFTPGSYTAKAIVTGNGKYILDADNTSETSFMTFTKLATPQLKITGGKLDIDAVNGAVKYGLTENGNILENSAFPYDLSTKAAGEYRYSAYAVGNGGNILDSNNGNEIKVKKLTQPTILLDKSTLIGTIDCVDADYVQDYSVYINGTKLTKQPTPSDNTIDCSTIITSADTYVVRVVANPVDSDEYALIVPSERTETKTQLTAECSISVEDGNLIIEPTSSLNPNATYTLAITIDKGTANEAKLSNIQAKDGKFVINVLDDMYNVKNFASIFENPGSHTIHTVIGSSENNELNSIETECDTLNVLGKVNTVSKQAQSIKFNAVTGATTYKAIIELNGAKKLIDLTGKYTGYAVNIDVLKDLMVEAGIDYVENMDYSIQFIAVTTNPNTFSNVGGAFVFKFANKPTIKIQANTNDEKLITFDDGLQHEVIIEQGETVINLTYDGTAINLDKLIGVKAGEVKISAKTIASDGNKFNSEYRVVTATKLAAPTPTIQNGVASWPIVEHVKYYVLRYMEDGENKTVELSETSDKFTIDTTNGICKYDFIGLTSGEYSLTLQVYSEEGSYLNSDKSSAVSVYKLITPEIGVEYGMVSIIVDSSTNSLRNMQSIELKFGNKTAITDMAEVQFDYISIANGYSHCATAEKFGDKTKIMIDVTELIEYGDEELLSQDVSVKLLAMSNKPALNSETATTTVQGLLAPRDIKMEKTSTIINGVAVEGFATISWSNPEPNEEYVKQYEVFITYKGMCKDRYKETTYKINGVISYDNDLNRYYISMPKYYNDSDIDGDGYEYFEEDANYNEILDPDEDIDGNGQFNSIERLFRDGEYVVSIRALTENGEQFVHSAYSSITMTALPAPTNVQTDNGNIKWTKLNSAASYIVRIYNLTDPSVEVKKISTTATTLDVSNIELADGVYGVTVQALNSNDNTLISSESEIKQMIRLPKVTSYYIDDGLMCIRLHRFFGACKITLVSKEDNTEKHEVTFANTLQNNEDVHGDVFEEFVSETYFKWRDSGILNTFNGIYNGINYMELVAIPMEMVMSTDNTGYDVYITLIGNSHEKSGILTTPTVKAECDAGLINRLPTPTVEIDETTRGVLNLKVIDAAYTMRYEDRFGHELTGAHLYRTIITTGGKDYYIYMAEAIGTMKLDGIEISSTEKYIEFNGLKYNIVTKTGDAIKIDFNTQEYEVYNYWKEIESTSFSLREGGAFVLTMQMLGDDTRFIRSKVSEAKTVLRYKPIDHNDGTLLIINGQIKWEKQTVASDDSVYLLEVDNGSEIINIMLYKPSADVTEDSLKTMLADEGKIGYYFDTISYTADDQYIVYNNLANKLIEIDAAFNGGNYTIRVKSHYTNVTAKNVVLAQIASAKSISIIPKASISVVNGTLTWNQPSLPDSSATGIKYFTNYQLQVFEGASLVTTINLTSVDYDIKGSNIEYDLKRIYVKDGRDEFKFKTQTNYTFKLVAVGDNDKYISSVEITVENKQILNDIGSDLKITTKQETGANDEIVNAIYLNWTGTTRDEILIEFIKPSEDGGVKYSYTEIVTGGEYKLPSIVYINNTEHKLISGYSYSFKVRAMGDNNNISGFFSSAVTIQKLFTVDEIKVNEEGLLTWKPSKYVVDFESGATSSDGITYRVECSYVNAKGESKTVLSDLITETVFDLSNIDADEIDIVVYAYCEDYASSDESKKVELSRLNAPNASTIAFEQDGTVLTWTPIKHNGSNHKHYLIKVSDGTNEVTYGYELKDSPIATWDIVIDDVFVDKDANNTFIDKNVKFSIKALVVSGGTLLDSLYSTEVEQTITAKVAGVAYDSAKYAIKWTALEGSGYKYYLGYTFNETTHIYKEVTNEAVKEGDLYYYNLTTIGSYSDVYVRVVGSTGAEDKLASQPTWCSNREIEFNLFESGSGVENEEYIIIDETQLRNIKFLPNANYKLGANIDLKDNSVIAENFSGSLDGDNHYIFGDGVNISNNRTDVGLFVTTIGAKFKNINLSGFDIGITAESLNMNIAIFVTNASNTTFTNVSILNSTIVFNLVQTDTSAATINIGAIAAYASNSTFVNCEVLMDTDSTPNINVSVTGPQRTVVALGSIVGYVVGGEITSSVNSSQLTYEISTSLASLQGSNKKPQLYLGTVAGIKEGTKIEGDYYLAKKDGESYSNVAGFTVNN